MKNNKKLVFTTFILGEIVLILLVTLGLQVFLAKASENLKQANLSLQTNLQQVKALAFVEPALGKEKLISAELTAYPTGEASVDAFISELPKFAKVAACEVEQVTAQAVVPVTPPLENGAGTTPTTPAATTPINEVAFSLATINVQINANYSELISFVAQIRQLQAIVGISANNFGLPLDARRAEKKFINLPIFFIFKTN